MNEQKHFFIRIYLLHFIQKGWCWLCMIGELETGTDSHILTQSSSDHSSISFAPWMGFSTVGHWGPQALSLQADSHAGILSPTDSNCKWNSNWLKPSCANASAPNSTTSTGQSDILISSTGCTCFAVLPLIYTGASNMLILGRGSTCYTPTPRIIPHRLPAFLESLMPRKTWCSICARCPKSSLKNSIRFCGIFSTFNAEFHCILFF